MPWIFDGVDDRVTFDDNAALQWGNSTELALAGWVKLASNAGTQSQYMLSWAGYNANPSFNFLVYEASNANANKIEVHSNITAFLPASTAFGQSTAWQHVVIQRTSGNIWEIFLDGVSLGTASIAGATNVAGSWFFGARSDLAAARWLNGKMAEWAKWDRILTGTEITELATGALPEDYATSLVWHSKAFGDFTEDIAGLTVTATGATASTDDHPINRSGGGGTTLPTPSFLTLGVGV